MDNHLGNHAEEEVLDQTESETGLGPVVAPFEDVEHVALELDLAIEVLLLESLDGDLLLAVVCIAVLLLVELEVVLDGLARELGLLVLAGRELRGQPPERPQNGEGGDQSNEDPCLQATSNLPGEVCGDTNYQRDESVVVERVAARALSRERGIGNGGILFTPAVSSIALSLGSQWLARDAPECWDVAYRSGLDPAVEIGDRLRRRRRFDELESLLRSLAAHLAQLQ